MSPGTQIHRGIGLATLSSLLFGAMVPFLKMAGAEVGISSWASASLLYLGAAIFAGLVLVARRRPVAADLLRGRAFLRLILVAMLGGALAPALLIMGVQRTDAATTSLLLTLEMPLTVLLARAFLREQFGRRAIVAATFVLGGSVLLAGQVPTTDGSLAGIAFVAAAAAVWALDNTVSRTLADQDPLAVVAGKGLIGGLISGGLAAWSADSFPGPGVVTAILAIGAVGNGLSLQLYLQAQKLVGAARTASVFASAPFVGMVVALLLGSPWPGWHFPIAAGLLFVGVALHISERHGHAHTHQVRIHEHMHTHDDGHHLHSHDPQPAGPHSHVHEHAAITHEHEHGEDIHHRHQH